MFKSMQVEKDQLYTLSHELLGTRVPSSSYPVFLFEQLIWFKLRDVKERRPDEIATSTKFLETLLESDLEDQKCCVSFICMKCLALWTTIQILSLSQVMFS